MNADTQLGEAVDFNSFFPESDNVDLYISSIDYTTENDKDENGIFMCFTYSDESKKYLDMSQFLANTYEAGDGIVINGNVISIDSAIKGKIESIETELASKADIKDVELLEAAVTEVAKDVASVSADVNVNKTNIASLQARINALNDNKTIGITNEGSLYVKILKKDGNLLSIGEENGESGLCAFVPVYCEDEELNEE
jgi:hypothetical protein